MPRATGRMEIRLALQGSSARDWIDAAPRQPSPRRCHPRVAKVRAGRLDGVASIIADSRGNPMRRHHVGDPAADVPICAHARDGPETLDVPPIVGRLPGLADHGSASGGSHDVPGEPPKLIHNRYVASSVAPLWRRELRGRNSTSSTEDPIDGRVTTRCGWSADSRAACGINDGVTQSVRSWATKVHPLDRLAVAASTHRCTRLSEARRRIGAPLYYRAWLALRTRSRRRATQTNDGLVSWQNIQSDRSH